MKTSQDSSAHKENASNISNVSLKSNITGYPKGMTQSFTSPWLIQLPKNFLLRNQYNATKLQTVQFSTNRAALQAMQGSKEVTQSASKCPAHVEEIKKRIACPRLPPCLKFVRPPGARVDYDTNRIDCGRICMPCCPQARYPPLCYFPHEKAECIKYPNPRPAFSECPKACYQGRSICDCCSTKPPPCRLLPDIHDEC